MASTPLYNLPYYAAGDPANFPVDSPAMMNATESAIKGLTIIKPSDQTLATTTLTDDTALISAVQSTAVYEVELKLLYGALTGIGIKIGWTFPVGATMNWCADGLASAVVVTSGIILRAGQIITDAVTLGSAAAVATNVWAYPKGILTIGGTAGNLRLQWAQGAASGTGTVVRAGSQLKLKRIG